MSIESNEFDPKASLVSLIDRISNKYIEKSSTVETPDNDEHAERESKCLPRCDHISCEGCASKSTCTGVEGGRCSWDPEQNTCLRSCGRYKQGLRYGACWMCTSQFLCESEACSWDDDMDYCSSNDGSNDLSVADIDIINPMETSTFVDSIVGNLILEHANLHGIENDERGGGGVLDHLGIFWGFQNIRAVSGNVIITDNMDLTSVTLENLGVVHGDIRIVNNPSLQSIKLLPDIHVGGCVLLLNNPGLDTTKLGTFPSC